MEGCAGRRSRRERARAGRTKFRPGLDALEARQLQRVTAFNLTITPQVLAPTGRTVPVRVDGVVGVSQPIRVRPTVNYQFVDEYREVQSIRLNPVALRPGSLGPEFFEFSVTLPLRASVASNDPDGRQYILVFSAQDSDNSFGQVRPVLVTPPARRPIVDPSEPPDRFEPGPVGPRPVPPRFDPRFSPRPPVLPPRVPPRAFT